MCLWLLWACQKKTGEKYVSFRYTQIVCDEHWATGATDSATVVSVRRYLDSLELAPLDVQVRNDGESDACGICFCRTGKRFYVTTIYEEERVRRYGVIGFQQL
ncbi:hypothetical protein [Flaviaesturariibacter amylovorans]|uniref:DUF4258 domain-containing protein n=1 Tax=Flaviaesturariibacter amylovorans TaxID=1084520 RepID=A0ABP8H3L6_9BACT